MVKGLRHAALALIPKIAQQDVVSNNLANVSTPGFKRDRLFVEILKDQTGDPSPDAQGLSLRERMATDHAQGQLRRTGEATDLALNGDGFFVVRTANGERLTRGGSFHVSGDGAVLDAAGNALMTTDGELYVDPTSPMPHVGADGTLTSDGRPLGRLRVATISDPDDLLKVGGNLYRGGTWSDAENFEIRQGHVEDSNAVGIQEMTTMISLFRGFEAAQKAIQIQGDSVDTAVSQVGRVRG